MNRVKELREEKIKEETIAEVQRQQGNILVELKRIEVKEDPKYSNWRRELNEDVTMSTANMGMINLAADPDTIQTSIPSTSITSADNDGPPTDDGLVIRNQSFQVVDATKTDTITLTISGSFITKTVDGLELNDKVSIGVKVGGTYVGNYLAGDPSGGGNNGLGNGTHTITIPQRFRKAGVKFDAIQITAFEGESGTVSITGAGLKRVNPMNVLVSLDDPEALSFIRGGLGGSEERRARLKDMLDAGNELMVKMGLEPNKTAPGDIELANVTSDARNPMGTGDQAALSLAVGLVASPMGQMALAAGAAAVATLLGITIQKAHEVVNQANAMNIQPSRPGTGGIAGGRDLTPGQQAEVQAAADELRDARRALNDLPADATDAQKDMAQERLDRANKNRSSRRNKHKQENQQRPRTDGG